MDQRFDSVEDRFTGLFLYTLQLCLCATKGCMDSAIPIHYKHIAFATLTCFLFVAHLPERLAPGRFDYFGKS